MTPPYIIAEIGSNHNGDMGLCRQIIDAARESGADAVKFQSWTKDTLISRAEYERNTQYGPAGQKLPSLEEVVEQYQFTPDQHREIAAYCRERDMMFLSSCFSPAEVDLLESLDVPLHKIASMDVNNLPLLAYVAQTGKPIVLSTGMATLGEVERALNTLRTNGAGPLIVLHCISIYPAPPEAMHLRNMGMFQHAFGVLVGLSDHSQGITVPLAATALGACMIEKHFTTDKSLPGWDHAISADPPEMQQLVQGTRDVVAALGSAQRLVGPDELEKRKAFRRRMVARRALQQGETLTADAVDFKRPGTGINPDELAYVLGRPLKRDVAAEEALEWTDFA
jgi:N-acetylneuraminate synthase